MIGVTIYATPYRASDKECTGPSTDTGFRSLKDAVAAMGAPDFLYPKMAVYGSGEDRVVLGGLLLCVDAPVNSG